MPHRLSEHGLVVAIDASWQKTCVVTTTGKVVCFDGSGELAQIKFDSSINITTVTLGWDHFCALKDNGAVVCWGEDREGNTIVPSDLSY